MKGTGSVRDGGEGSEGVGVVEVAERLAHGGKVMNELMMPLADRHPSLDIQHEFASAATMVALCRFFATALTLLIDELAARLREHELFTQFSIFQIDGVSL